MYSTKSCHNYITFIWKWFKETKFSCNVKIVQKYKDPK